LRFDSGLLARVGDISSYPQVDEWLALPKLLESCGFTGVWSAEHHFGWDVGVTPTPTNPLMLGAYVAAATRTLRIGQCGVALPAHHPLRVAEDAAMLDHMTGGRMEFGFMKGLNGKVSRQFDPATGIIRDHDKTNADLMWDAFEVIKKFWSGKPFRHDGPYFTFPSPWDGSATPKELRDPRFYADDGTLIALQGLPTPLQKPLPPCWVMVDSVYSTTQAAAKGVGTVCWAKTFEGSREVWTAYREAAKKALADGTLPAGANLRTAMMRPTFVAKDTKAAEAVMRPALNGLFGRIFGLDGWLGRRAMLASWEKLTPAEEKMDWYDYLRGRNQCFVGSPEAVTEQLKQYEQELGAEHLIMYWALPGVTFEQQTASLELFADKVMPNFSSAQPGSVLSATADATA
jgi:alkanesulfonate monooxygenase SsuD/methylene tetrahydromethanopterin reductase-like flavin-dependent oxidoreductase (luciferase family)